MKKIVICIVMIFSFLFLFVSGLLFYTYWYKKKRDVLQERYIESVSTNEETIGIESPETGPPEPEELIEPIKTSETTQINLVDSKDDVDLQSDDLFELREEDSKEMDLDSSCDDEDEKTDKDLENFIKSTAEKDIEVDFLTRIESEQECISEIKQEIKPEVEEEIDFESESDIEQEVKPEVEAGIDFESESDIEQEIESIIESEAVMEMKIESEPKPEVKIEEKVDSLQEIIPRTSVSKRKTRRKTRKISKSKEKKRQTQVIDIIDTQEARKEAKKDVAKEIAKEITEGIFKLIDKAEVKNKVEAQRENKKISKEEKEKRDKETYKNYLRPSILFLGEIYNHAFVEDYKDRRWVINASFNSSKDFKAFNSCSNKVCLSDLLFGRFRIQDIFLLSKLSYEDKIYLIDVDLPLEQDRLARNRKVDQYLAYVAPFHVCINAEKKEKWVDFGAFYRFSLGKDEDVVCSLGFNIPVKSCTHIMSLDLVGVDMTKCGFTEDDIHFVLNDFHQNFIDVTDFFKRVVLEPKGLCFCERQNKVGIGDVKFFALFDVNRLTERFDGLQFGLDVTVPSGNKYQGKNVWEVILGNGGAVQLGFSANALFKSSKKYVNPLLGIGGKVSFEFQSCRRVPRLVQSISVDECTGDCCDCENNKVGDTPCLLAPVFKTHYVKPFAEYDSCVYQFADCAVNTKTKIGGIGLFTLGNYFYNVFRETFRLGIFYDFLYKARDNVFVCEKNAIYNTNALEECTKVNWHQFSWHLAYVSDVGIEINVGSKHIFYAKNYPQTNSLFASFIANF